MEYQQWHAAVIKKRKPTTLLRLWFFPSLFGFVIFASALMYLYLQNGRVSFDLVNRSFAISAIILIGGSFALSGICYFWDFLDSKIIYRRYLGLTGFGFGLTHALVSVYYYFLAPQTNSESYTFNHMWIVGEYFISNVVAFLFGLGALLIFIMMTAISNRFAIRELGGKRWRQLLRVGYLALFFLLFHFGIKNFAIWSHWIKNQLPHPLPPTSLIIFLFVIFVLSLRVALWIALIKHRNITPRTQPQEHAQIKT